MLLLVLFYLCALAHGINKKQCTAYYDGTLFWRERRECGSALDTHPPKAFTNASERRDFNTIYTQVLLTLFD